MRKNKKQTKSEKFIEKQIDDLNNSQVENKRILEEDKNSFAGKVETTIDMSDSTFNSDYFADAFRRIDADRISTQLEFNEEVDNPEEVKAVEDEKRPQDNTDISNNKPQLEIVEVKEDKKKVSFFDKLLKAL